MTALASSYDPKRKEGELIRYPLAAGAHVFKGALVSVSSTTGYAVPGADAAGAVCVGVAFEEGNNIAGGVQYDGSISSGAAGAVGVRVQPVGLYEYHKTGAVQADVGKQAFIVDDNTVATVATTNSVRCGVVGALVDGGTLAILIDGRIS